MWQKINNFCLWPQVLWNPHSITLTFIAAKSHICYSRWYCTIKQKDSTWISSRTQSRSYGLMLQRNMLNSLCHSELALWYTFNLSIHVACSLLLHYTSEYSSPINFPMDSCASLPNLATRGRKWINGETPLPLQPEAKKKKGNLTKTQLCDHIGAVLYAKTLCITHKIAARKNLFPLKCFPKLFPLIYQPNAFTWMSVISLVLFSPVRTIKLCKYKHGLSQGTSLHHI